MRPASSDVDGLPAVPAGLLRVFSRNEDREVLIVHGAERKLRAGERLAWEERLPSNGVAIAISHFCSGRLIMSQFPPDAEGWHPFQAAHLKTLLADARNNLNVTYFPPPAVPRERREWTSERKAWLGFRAGQGWTAQAIADDPFIASTEAAVHKQAQRLGISLAHRPHSQATIRLPAAVLAAYEAAAPRQGLTRDALIARAVVAGRPDLAA